jgi:uncharacterized membrane protein YqiK
VIQKMTRIRVAVADWLSHAPVPVLVVVVPFLVAGAVVWFFLLVPLFMMFVVMVPVGTVGMFVLGWDGPVGSPGWDLIVLAAGWAIWLPVMRYMSR